MGRKKKVIKEQGPTTSTSSLTYKGSISVTTLKGKKVLNTKRYTNNGTNLMFKFLGKCLGGRYAEADAIRPKYIHLWKIDEEGEAVPETINWNSLTNASLVSVLYKESPETSLVTAGGNTKVVTKFSFMVPYTQIIGNTVNLIAIYPTPDIDSSNVSAFFIVRDEENEKKLGNLVDPTITNRNEYNLFIEWDMEINN